MTNANLLKKARIHKHLEVQALAALSGMSEAELLAIELGKQQLTVAQAKRLGEILEVLSEELLGEITDEEEQQMKLDRTVVITTATNKGGEGKTSVTGNLAYQLKELGYRVLLVDTDGQMNLTQSYGIPENEEKNFYQAMLNKESLMNHIVPTQYEGIDMVPGAAEMKQVEAFMATTPMAEQRPFSLIKPVRAAKVYDFVLIDTNPTISKINTAIICASDEVLIPLEAGIFGVSGLGNIIECVNEVMEYHEHVNILGIVLNKVDGRVSLNNDARDIVTQVFQDKKLNAEISQDTNIKNAQWQQMPIGAYQKSSKATKDFMQLAKEVVEIVKNR